MARLASGTSVREDRFMGEATASTGRRYQKALHNHPRKLIGIKKADLDLRSLADRVGKVLKPPFRRRMAR